MSKRKKTNYTILARGREEEETLVICGSVEALTPSHARRRGAKDLPLLRGLLEATGSLEVYAIPEQSFRAQEMGLEKVDRVISGVGA